MTIAPQSSGLSSRTRRAILTNMMIASLISLAATLFYWYFKFDGNITGFFRIGDTFPISPFLDSDRLLIYAGQPGYDGQFFLTIGLDPSLSSPSSIAALDTPSYRYQRILYPLVGYVLGLGQSKFIPYTLVAINTICIALIVGLMTWAFTASKAHSTELRQQENGISPNATVSSPAHRLVWQPLLVLCIPGVWMILAFSTADLVSSLLLTTAFCCYHKGKQRQTAGAVAMACLARETMALGWLALLLDSLRHQNWAQVRGLLVAILPVLAWREYIHRTLPQTVETRTLANTFGVPFSGVVNKLGLMLQGGLDSNNLFEAYTFLLLAATFATLLWTARRSSKTFAIWLAGLFYAVLFVSSDSIILEYFLGYGRVYIDAFFLLLLSWGLGQSRTTASSAPSGLPRAFAPQAWLLAAGAIPSLAFVLLSQ